MATLILGLGNDLCGDDGAGIAAAAGLKPLASADVDVVTCRESGLALIDYLLGYSRVIIIDAISLPGCAPGTVLELNLNDLRRISNPSPHYTGLPEIKKIADELGVGFPDDVRIFAVAVKDVYEIGRQINRPVAAAVNEIIERVKSLISAWHGP